MGSNSRLTAFKENMPIDPNFPCEQLKRRILSEYAASGKSRLVMMNNVPLEIRGNDLQLNYLSWAGLPYSSLKLVCEVANSTISLGGKASLIFFADDHTYGNPAASWYQAARSRFYKRYNSTTGELPEIVEELLSENNLSIQNLILSDHEKAGRESCIYFSEVSLRHQRKDIENPCARELIQVFGDPRYFNAEFDHLVLPILSMCERGVCNAALPSLRGQAPNFTETTIVFNYDRDLDIYDGLLEGAPALLAQDPLFRSGSGKQNG